MANTFNVQSSGSSVVNALLLEYAWADRTLNYGFRVQDIDNNGISDFNEGNWRGFYKFIFDNTTSYTGLKFRETSFDSSLLGQVLEPGGGGQSAVPYPWIQGNTYTIVRISGSVAGASAVIYPGHWSEVWFHEIGHSLGLNHPFERPGALQGVNSAADLGTNFLNSALYTVMSYSAFVWGEDNPWTAGYDPGRTVLNASAGSFMPIDVATLQHLYGTQAKDAGNTVHSFGDNLTANRGYTTIWDTGGVDTIRYTGSSDAKIDLRAATLREEIGGGGFLSTSRTLTGGFLIANGVAIENAAGGDGNDLLQGNALDNRLNGNGGSDTLIGAAGNDVLDGGLGADRMTGGTGDDIYVVDNAGDVVVEAAGEGDDRVNSSVSHTLAENVERLGLRAGGLTGTGNALDNILYAHADGSTLDGAGGNDTLYGGGGADTLLGGAGNDILFGGLGNDRLSGGEGNDTLKGGAGADLMAGGGGNDGFTVDDAGDVVTEAAGGGDDTVTSSIGYVLPEHVERLFLTGAGLTGTGNAGNNHLHGSGGADTLEGLLGDDRLYGGAGDDRLLGGAGNDVLYGGAGDDLLDGAGGADVLFGGTQADSFLFRRSDVAGRDTISDFSHAEGDVVRLIGFQADSFPEILASIIQIGSEARLNLGEGQLVVFKQMAMSQFTESDFVFG